LPVLDWQRVAQLWKFIQKLKSIAKMAAWKKPQKSAQRRCKHCALAVVRRNQKFSRRCRHPSRGCRTAKISSAGEGLYFYLQTQFGEDWCTQFWVIVVAEPPTNKQTNKQTGPITVHCVAASAQCNKICYKFPGGTLWLQL